jgi:hypothetical protein
MVFFLGLFKKSLLKFYSRHLLRFIDEIKLNQGLILEKLNQISNVTFPKSSFSVFSQWGEDGIIQYLINNIDISEKSFIEFGVEDFIESNCRFLMMKDNWDGYVIDGSSFNIQILQQSYFFWRYNLTAVCAFITKDNINHLLSASSFPNEVGLLSIDIDGNDYYVLDEIITKPSILICEFNSIFGPDRKISVPYNSNFDRTVAHYSNLFWGASLSAINYAAEKKGLVLVGVNDAFNNAFFVRRELLNDKVVQKSVSEVFGFSKYRESRSIDGKLTSVSGKERVKLIDGLSVFNVESKELENF